MVKIYITGVSGTGKTSLTEALKAKGVNAVDTDELSHWENKHTGERTGWEPGASDAWYNEHEWLCDIAELQKVLSKTEHAVAIGFGDNIDKSDKYLKLFDKVCILTCRPETIVARIEGRTNNHFGKHPSDMRRILEWQKEFDAEMVEKGALPLDAERPLEELAAHVRSLFE